MPSLLLLLTVIIKSVLSTQSAEQLVITLSDGPIRGAQYITKNDKVFYGFQGIPFATPPVGDLRFEAPKPPKAWTEVLNTTADSKACISTRYSASIESEDCLYINVYTPSLKQEDKLPVMFWIYGGAFKGGSGDRAHYGPEFLIEEDVILVTHNYRVGLFGLLSTGDTEIRGNAGLKDQVLALKWVRDNIEMFGGDPEKVTIFGQSAGGQSTGLQLLSRQSAGLFRAAIVESGGALVNSSCIIDPRTYAFQLGDLIPGGSYGNDSSKLKIFLKETTVDDLVVAANALTGEDVHAWPTMEVEDEDAFLSEAPFELLESGRFNQVPIVIGMCAQESLVFISENINELALMLDNDPKKVIPSDLRPDVTDEAAAIEKIKNIYLQEGETFSNKLSALSEYITDNKFVRGILKHAELSSKYVPVYLYQFAYYGRLSFPPFTVDGVEKAGHGAEIPFIFNQTGVSDNDPDVANLLIQNRMTKLWTNFAKYLNPTPEQSELLDNLIWPTIHPDQLQYMNINGSLEVRQDLREKFYLSWNETYYQYGRKPFVTF